MSYINESVIYNIYPLGFSGALRFNDGQLAYRLDKIYEWIPHFKKLSVNCVVFNPLFESSFHGYDTIDYKKVDCRLGDNESFKRICKALHENGIKVILDGVFNHVGREFFAFKDLQQKLGDSRYVNWFQNVRFNERSPKGDPFNYEGWAGHYDLVKLNLKNPETVDYLLSAVELWLNEFDIDGLRLDAADCIDLEFFKKLRSFCKSKKPDFWLYGEITHGDYNRWANGETLDSTTNYECYKGIYSSHNDHNYFEIAHSLNRQFGNGGIYKNIYTYNFVDNHDVDRIASTLKDKNHLYNSYTLLYTMPGVPSIYYGSEFGIEAKRTHHSDIELRPSLDLNNIPDPDLELERHIARLGKIRLSLDALKYGDYENINIQNEKLVFRRRTEKQTVFVTLNLSDRNESIDFDTGCNSKLTDVLSDNEVIDVNGYYSLPLKPYSARILVVNDGGFRIDFDSADIPEKIERSALKPEIELPAPELPDSVEIEAGRYRHCMGDEYEVFGLIDNDETGEKLVIYKELFGRGEFLARPADKFTDEIEINGMTQKRFTRI